MRVTLAIDDDVLETARALAARINAPFRQVINDALRVGLQTAPNPPAAHPYRTRPHTMELRTGRNLDNIQELLAQIDGVDRQ